MHSIKSEFPIFERKVNGKPLVYLDNAATTQKPRSVIEAEKRFYEESNANIHRGFHTLAEEATAMYEKSRDLTAEFLSNQDAKHTPSRQSPGHPSPASVKASAGRQEGILEVPSNGGGDPKGGVGKEEIIFTKNCTEAINLVAYSWAREFLKAGDTILLSIMEHHANWVPWHELAKQNKWKIEYVDIKDDGTLDVESFQSAVNRKQSTIKLIAICHQSNVLGTINPIKNIIQIGHDHKAKVLIDAAQSVSHIPIDVKKLDVDFLAFSAHKMFGPTGVGVLYGKKELLTRMPPFLTGGEMIKSVSKEEIIWNDLPWKFEAGTPNIAGVASFGEAIRFIQSLKHTPSCPAGHPSPASAEASAGRQEGNKKSPLMEGSRSDGRLGDAQDKLKAGVGMSGAIPLIDLHLKRLTEYALQELQKIEKLTLYGPRDSNISRGIISFNINGVHAHDVSSILDEEGIAIRSGAHCAQPLMKRLGVDAVARASFTIYNDKHDVDALVEGIEKVKRVFKM